MNIDVGQKALITFDNWFLAPDGKQYRAAFGTVKSLQTAEQTLGIRPNAKSTNWYVEIGCLTVAGCQIHYAVRCDACNFGAVEDWRHTDNGIRIDKRPTSIFDADGGCTS